MSTYLRKATSEDCNLLFAWANDSETRKNSFATEKIRKEEHVKWFERLLEETHRVQYIYMDDEEPIGQVRIDICDSVAEISYSICSAKRGMGHGKNLLKLLYNQVLCDFPEVKKLIGKVKSENIASQKVFLDVGFTEKYRAFEIDVNEQMTAKERTFCKGGVLLLTNNWNALKLYEWLSLFEEVYLFSERLTLEQIRNINPTIIISYNYNYIIAPDIIEYMNGKIINMHISFLPWNRGASPNIWSFVDDTPKGVTIHQVSAGLDKGNIIYQKECFFDTEKETFASTYEKLNVAIVELFKEHWQEIKTGVYPLKKQVGKGTYHSQKDLIQLQNIIPFEWTDNIEMFLKRYHSSYK